MNNIMELHYINYIFKNPKSWFLMKKKNLNLENISLNFVVLHLLVYRGDILRPVFSQKSLLTKFLFSTIIKSFVFRYKLWTLIHTSLISVRSENQSVSKVFWDKDSESSRFQFDQGTYPRLSQSNVGVVQPF